MPKINVSLDDISKLIGQSLSAPELEKLLLLVKGELKSYDAQTGQVKLELGDTNRPDLWSAEGIARQLRCHREGQPASYSFWQEQTPVSGQVEVDPQLSKIRPYIGAFIAKGVTVDEILLRQLIESQEKLCENYGRRRRTIAIGIYNYAPITFPVHYRAHLPTEKSFVPLGMEQSLNLAQILEQHPKGIEYGHILSSYARYPLLYDDQQRVLSMPPIINSREVGEVQVGERDLFIEATGTDIQAVLHALNILAVNLADRGATIMKVRTVYPYDTPLGREVVTPYPFALSMTLPLAQFERLLGTAYPAAEIEHILQQYGLQVSQQDAELTATLPPYRLDYMHPVDVIEDFAISAGYDSFAPIMPQRFTVGRLAPITLWLDQVRDLMVGFGFEELITNILLNRTELNTRMQREASLVEIDNVMSSTYSAVRNSLLPALCKAEAASSKSLYPHRLFEVGEVALWDPKENLGSQTANFLAALIAQPDTNFSQMHSFLELLLYYLGFTAQLEPASDPSYIDGRCGRVMVAEHAIGLIGEVHPAVLSAWDIKMPCSAMELDLGLLLQIHQEQAQA